MKDYQLQASLCKWLLMTECWTDATGCCNLKRIMNRENTHCDNLLWRLKGVLFILGKHAQIPTAFIGRFGQFAFPTQSLLQQLHKHKNIKAFHFFLFTFFSLVSLSLEWTLARHWLCSLLLVLCLVVLCQHVRIMRARKTLLFEARAGTACSVPSWIFSPAYAAWGSTFTERH